MNGIILDSLDPTYNLALEQHLFDTLTPDMPGWFLLWQNGPSIIVGRHQNTVQEVNQELIRRFDLPVVRRVTGGGAVYHDTGNLNFSFLQPHARNSGNAPLDFALFLRPIVEALADVGVQAAFSSRNDLTVDGRKVSGSAQLRRPHGVLHHGTLLVNLDMDMLGAVLTGAPDKYLSKGIASLRSRVANLAEFFPDGDATACMARIKNALLQRCATQLAQLPPDTVAAATQLAHTRYRTWDWNYGSSPAFTARWRERFAWGAVECCLEVRKGHIAACRIFGDFFSQREVAELEALLCGQRYAADTLRAVTAGLDEAAWDSFFAGCDTRAMRDFFCR